MRQLSRKELQQLIAEKNFAGLDIRVATFFAERYGNIDAGAEFSSDAFENPIVFRPEEHDKLVATQDVEFLPNGNCLWNCTLVQAIELAASLEGWRSPRIRNSPYIFRHKCTIYVPRDLQISFI